MTPETLADLLEHVTLLKACIVFILGALCMLFWMVRDLRKESREHRRPGTRFRPNVIRHAARGLWGVYLTGESNYTIPGTVNVVLHVRADGTIVGFDVRDESLEAARRTA